MPISSDEAAHIARRHGLTLVDASALRALADTAEQAEELARRFQQLPRPEAVAESIARKSAELARLHREADPDGRPRPVAEPVSDPPPPDPANLQSALAPLNPLPPLLAEQVAAAEAAGDLDAAQRLKAEQLGELLRRNQGSP